MSYIQKTLLSEEKLIFATNPHPIVFSTTVFAFIVAGFCLWYGPKVGLGTVILFGFEAYELAAMLCALFGIYALIRSFIFYKYSEYGITDRRIIMKTGLIQRNSLEMFLDKVEAIRVDQTIAGRIFKYGTISIVGTGGTVDPFYAVPNPLSFRHLAQQMIDREMHENGHKPQ